MTFPNSMQEFRRGTHDAVILDDVRDLQFLVAHQHVLQGKPSKRTRFAETPGGQCAYMLYLFGVPFVVTANFTTKGLDLLDTDDFLAKPENRVVLHLTEPPWEGEAPSVRAVTGTPEEQMGTALSFLIDAAVGRPSAIAVHLYVPTVVRPRTHPCTRSSVPLHDQHLQHLHGRPCNRLGTRALYMEGGRCC